jgi:WD40 repeat protein
MQFCLPSGDRIASGGDNDTICIWDIKTGELLVGPVEDLGHGVTSLIWSSDNSRLYAACDGFARVIDSISGMQLHCFKHDDWLYSVALSPKMNVLACVGDDGVAQLWDIVSYQPLGQSFGEENRKQLNCVSFRLRWEIPSIWRR